jgi:hypothetical protein
MGESAGNILYRSIDVQIGNFILDMRNSVHPRPTARAEVVRADFFVGERLDVGRCELARGKPYESEPSNNCGQRSEDEE